jgi:hypothetical protein
MTRAWRGIFLISAITTGNFRYDIIGHVNIFYDTPSYIIFMHTMYAGQLIVFVVMVLKYRKL